MAYPSQRLPNTPAFSQGWSDTQLSSINLTNIVKLGHTVQIQILHVKNFELWGTAPLGVNVPCILMVLLRQVIKSNVAVLCWRKFTDWSWYMTAKYNGYSYYNSWCKSIKIWRLGPHPLWLQGGFETLKIFHRALRVIMFNLVSLLQHHHQQLNR